MREFDTFEEAVCAFCGKKLYTFASKVRGPIFDCSRCGIRRFKNGKMQVLQKSDETKWFDIPEGTLLVREEL